jgi:hypothetical protein
VLLNPKNESPLGLLAQFLQGRQLIEQRLGAKARCFILEFGQPLLAGASAVDRSPWIKPAPAIDRLQTILRARRIAGQILIGSTKPFELLLLVIALIDGLDRSDSQQLCECFGVIVIGLVALFDQLNEMGIVEYLKTFDNGLNLAQ